MAKRLYVGNLPYSFNDAQLKEVFEPHGQVVSSSVVMDRATNRSRGFGFIEMSTPEEAARATEAMNGAMIEGRPLTVNEARERAPRTGGFGGGGGGGYRGGDGGGYRGGDGGGYRGGGGGGGDFQAPPLDAPYPPRGDDRRRERDRSDRDDFGGGGRGGRGRGGY